MANGKEAVEESGSSSGQIKLSLLEASKGQLQLFIKAGARSHIKRLVIRELVSVLIRNLKR